jgi:hypothetical protein
MTKLTDTQLIMLSSAASESNLVIPFSPTVSAQKGITREPTNDGHIDAAGREKLMNAIRRACRWVTAVRSGEVKSFDEIAAQEDIGERHIRRLTPLAFLSPTLFSAIVDGASSGELTVSNLTEALPHSWAAQEEMFG